MKKTVLLIACLLPSLCLFGQEITSKPNSQSLPGDSYSVIIEGYDWGPGVSKVILPVQEMVVEAHAENYTVQVERSEAGVEMQPGEASGEREVIYAYVSDAMGNKADSTYYVTLTLFVSPTHVLGSPIKYVRRNNRGSNIWIDYKMAITDKTTGKVWAKEAGRILPGIDKFDLKGSFEHKGIKMSYASYAPPTDGAKKSPLIIWLHGGGEGGTDPSIPIIANKAWNYASEEIQSLFDGAYVLAPQSPTFWMQSASGEYTRGNVNDIYNEALMAMFRKYVADHPDIDTNRIYVGGCSNGGYMSLKLILEHPDYFAAGYISALAYQAEYLTNEQLQSIKDVPIWFVHAADDRTTVPQETVLPTYNRLIGAGAGNVHLSYYDHVVDITGFFGGDDYHYNGHWSWIYCHDNLPDFDFDGKPVLLNGRPVTIMEWMAAQTN